LERTQELLFEINDLVEHKRISSQPIFLDSPLGIHLTDVFKKYVRYFNDTAQTVFKSDKDLFSFPGLQVTLETEESKHILGAPNPKIIIAGSGMSNGGRIIHHEKNYLPDPNNTILLAGYQSMGTLGRLIEEGAKEVTILRETVSVRAHIEKISGYSGHKDMDHLIEFVAGIGGTIKKVFVVMGEPKSSLFLSQRLRDYVGVDARAPQFGDVVTINLDE
jgi:metallo-beta-lactamase family protein